MYSVMYSVMLNAESHMFILLHYFVKKETGTIYCETAFCISTVNYLEKDIPFDLAITDIFLFLSNGAQLTKQGTIGHMFRLE